MRFGDGVKGSMVSAVEGKVGDMELAQVKKHDELQCLLSNYAELLWKVRETNYMQIGDGQLVKLGYTV